MSDRINPGAVIVDSLRTLFLRRCFDEIGPRDALLDLGCGARPHAALYAGRVRHVVGTDMPNTLHGTGAIQVFSNAMVLPFASGSFDVVLCTEVMEHVPNPARLLSEVNRVLRPGGHLVLTTPFLVPIHEAPYDFFRYTRHGLAELVARSGLELRRIEPFGGLVAVFLDSGIRLQLKVWSGVARATRVRLLTRPHNPFVFLFVLLPQYLYLGLVRLLVRNPLARRAIAATTYATIGYGTLAVKPHTAK